MQRKNKFIPGGVEKTDPAGHRGPMAALFWASPYRTGYWSCFSTLSSCPGRMFDELYEELIKYPKVWESADDHAQPTTTADLNLDGRDIEAQRIDRALKKARYSKTEAAKILGISRTTLWRKLKRQLGPDRDKELFI